MKLRLTFTGDDVIPSRVITEVLGSMDKRLAQLEAKRIRSLYKHFNEISKDDAKLMCEAFRDGYKRKSFSMLQLESIRQGSVIVMAVMSAAGAGVVLQRMRGAVRSNIEYYFIENQKTTLLQASYDVKRSYERNYSISELGAMSAVSPVKTPSKTEKKLSFPEQIFKDVSDDKMVLYKTSKHSLEQPIMQPTDEIIQKYIRDQEIKKALMPSDIEEIHFVSIEPHEPPGGQHILDIKVLISKSKAPVLTYAALVDKYNADRGNVHRQDGDA